MTVFELRALLEQQPGARLVAVQLTERSDTSIEAVHGYTFANINDVFCGTGVAASTSSDGTCLVLRAGFS